MNSLPISHIIFTQPVLKLKSIIELVDISYTEWHLKWVEEYTVNDKCINNYNYFIIANKR